MDSMVSGIQGQIQDVASAVGHKDPTTVKSEPYISTLDSSYNPSLHGSAGDGNIISRSKKDFTTPLYITLSTPVFDTRNYTVN